MNIKDDSRLVKKGDIFVALKDNTYILDAIKNGASKVVVKNGSYNVSTINVKNPRKYLINYLKYNYYKQISDINLIGITGTNGKTTTCFLIYEALNKLGIKCGYIGTIGFYLDKKIKDLNNTTPDLIELYELLLNAKEKNYNYVVMEVSSHALEMSRINSLLFDTAIFTNLTHEHLNYHKTMKNYALAKQKLFKNLKKNNKTIVNIDDKYKNYFLHNDSITYGFNKSDYQIINYFVKKGKTYFKIKHKNNIYKFKMNLIGRYNIYNMLIVIIYLHNLNYSFKKIRKIIKNLKLPSGRMEKIKYKKNLIIIDYAHTVDATEKILKALQDIKHNNIYTVVGCGGEFDKEKRPIIGKTASELSDYVIITSDNPRNEDPYKIADEMIQNLDKINYEIDINRKNAINKGIQKLVKSDILLILGKGHENYQVINGEKIKFNDKEIVLDIIGR